MGRLGELEIPCRMPCLIAGLSLKLSFDVSCGGINMRACRHEALRHPRSCGTADDRNPALPS